ncbi:MAG: transcriptional regulator GcvA [Cellvibrionaceae bacterium]
MGNIPPLKSLQAFEAVARHLSFKLASEELHVTPTAISHHIKTLEDILGYRLFNRLTRTLTLTKAGEAYAPLIHEGFACLARASENLNNTQTTGEIAVSTTTSFATKWLGPRLHRFSKQHPDITVRIHASDSTVDFTRQNFDVGIRYGHGDYNDLHSAWLLEDKVAPVCTSDFPLVESLSTYPLIFEKTALIHYEWPGFTQQDPCWEKWFDQIGLSIQEIPVSTVYSDEHMCIQAAIEGHGVALVGLIAAADDIEAGRLVVPHSARLKNKSYYFVCPEASAESQKIVLFRDWLLDEADLFRDSKIGQQIE